MANGVSARSGAQSDLAQLVGLIAVAGAVVAAIVALALTGYLKRSFASLRKVREAMADIAQGQGDLNAQIDVSGNDEVGRIGAAFNAFSEKLRMLVKDVQNASSQVEVAARDIASGNQDLASRTEKQAGMIQACAHSMFQITDASNNSLANASEANRIAQQTAELAAAGGAKMTNFVATMDEIRESSQKINEIIAVIDGIAFQTNILALNAAAEAARAGVQGRICGGGRGGAHSRAAQRCGGARHPHADRALVGARRGRHRVAGRRESVDLLGGVIHPLAEPTDVGYLRRDAIATPRRQGRRGEFREDRPDDPADRGACRRGSGGGRKPAGSV